MSAPAEVNESPALEDLLAEVVELEQSFDASALFAGAMSADFLASSLEADRSWPEVA